MKDKHIGYYISKIGTDILYLSRQLALTMFIISYIIILKYYPILFSQEIYVRNFAIRGSEIPIYANVHALFLIIIFISYYIALLDPQINIRDWFNRKKNKDREFNSSLNPRV